MITPPPPRVSVLNWLAIVRDPELHSLRDLRGKHVEMLVRLRDQCLDCIFQETGVCSDDIMVYFHYHPSVWQLHVHFAYPYMQYNHRNVFRIHSINTVIDNLRHSSDYYQHANLQISLVHDSLLYKVMDAIRDSEDQFQVVGEVS